MLIQNSEKTGANTHFNFFFLIVDRSLEEGVDIVKSSCGTLRRVESFNPYRV